MYKSYLQSIRKLHGVQKDRCLIVLFCLVLLIEPALSASDEVKSLSSASSHTIESFNVKGSPGNTQRPRILAPIDDNSPQEGHTQKRARKSPEVKSLSTSSSHSIESPHDQGSTGTASRSRILAPTLESPLLRAEGKENSSTSTTNSSQTVGADFLVGNLSCRRKLYEALQRNEHDIAKAYLMIMALNKLGDAERIRSSHGTLSRLLPRFKTIINESRPVFSGYTYVDILCSLPLWHEALMYIFFDELKEGILRSTSQVLRARYYAVKWLEKTVKEIVQELLLVMSSENSQLLTERVKTFLNPEFIAQTFEHLFYQQITEKITSFTPATFEQNTPPIGIFEQLELIERPTYSPARDSL